MFIRSLASLYALACLAALPASASPLAPNDRQRPMHIPKPSGTPNTLELEAWISSQTTYSEHRILSNIAPFTADPTAKPGAVCASPSRHHPDYYYTWTRDSALVMNEIITWMNSTRNATYAKELQSRVDDYVGFTRHVQGLKGLKYGLGEAKFQMDGTPFTGSWCNAQTDGPAIRAYALARYCEYLVGHGDLSGGRRLYESVIAKDLDYVVREWRGTLSCDIWEESRGAHFYTRAAQWRALTLGVQLARLYNDHANLQRYESESQMLARDLERFWDAKNTYLMTTIDWSGGLGAKQSNLDSQVVLAALHFGTSQGGLVDVMAPKMLATVRRIIAAFEHLYPINRVSVTEINGRAVPIGVAIGRYPEDVYNGDGTSQGNPWSLITSGMAEYHYRLGLALVDAAAADKSKHIWVSSELGRLV
ncbi:hypothetical protein FBU59_004932, partial [Linderina macrospora]